MPQAKLHLGDDRRVQPRLGRASRRGYTARHPVHGDEPVPAAAQLRRRRRHAPRLSRRVAGGRLDELAHPPPRARAADRCRHAAQGQTRLTRMRIARVCRHPFITDRRQKQSIFTLPTHTRV